MYISSGPILSLRSEDLIAVFLPKKFGEASFRHFLKSVSQTSVC